MCDGSAAHPDEVAEQAENAAIERRASTAGQPAGVASQA